MSTKCQKCGAVGITLPYTRTGKPQNLCLKCYTKKFTKSRTKRFCSQLLELLSVTSKEKQ